VVVCGGNVVPRLYHTNIKNYIIIIIIISSSSSNIITLLWLSLVVTSFQDNKVFGGHKSCPFYSFQLSISFIILYATYILSLCFSLST
jgi:hypothetical protein